MATNKQTVILKHGTNAPSGSFQKGELLVQHATAATETALHTVDNAGSLVAFPSKPYVDAEVAKAMSAASAASEAASKAKTTLTEKSVANGGSGIKVTKSQSDPNNYTIEAVNLAAKSELPSVVGDETNIISTGTTAGIKVTKSGTQYTVQAVNLATKTELGAVESKANAANAAIHTITATTGTANVIDTLKDVVDWIGDNAEGAAKIISDVDKLNKALPYGNAGFSETKTVKATTDDLYSKIEALNGQIGDVDQNFVKGITVYKIGGTETLTPNASTKFVDLTSMVIDCGEY